ncbi:MULTISPECIES: hypothetical protein [unclassified Paenibacillus]|uniref:hypothetical protein n=1 Tax=unclassified Paenibacillus TaxID=185978 RepID=UPI0030F76D4E
MLKKLIIIFAFCFIAVGISPYAAVASNDLFKTPTSKQSDQWKVEIKKVEKYDSKMSKPRENESEMYNIIITNIGVGLKNVVFNSYRDEPNTQTKYGLSISDDHRKNFKHGEIVDFSNFPISINSKELQIEISWYGKPSNNESHDRKYKETFTFTPAK